MRFSSDGRLAAAYSAASQASREALGVVVADDGVLVRFGATLLAVLFAFPQPHQAGVRFGKVPGQHERVLRLGAGGDLALQADGADGVALGRLGAELAVVGKVVPEQQRAGPPLGPRPAAQVGHLALPRRRERTERQRTGQRSVLGHLRIGHEQAVRAPRRCDTRWSALLIRARRPTIPRRSTPTALSSEKAIDTFAVSFAGLVTT